MPAHFDSISESAIRDMARQAASLHLYNGLSATDAVVKVASAREGQLTDQHVHRICEMAYHDIYEKMFHGSQGSSRVVNFDPPDPEQAVAALHATELPSFLDKNASALGVSAMVKHASADQDLSSLFPTASKTTKPRTHNAFMAKMAEFEPQEEYDASPGIKELVEYRADMKEALAHIQGEVNMLRSQEKVAFVQLVDVALRTHRQGMDVADVAEACGLFAKSAGVASESVERMVAALATGLVKQGAVLDNSKYASAPRGVRLNPQHPLNELSVKVAHYGSAASVREAAVAGLEDKIKAITLDIQVATKEAALIGSVAGAALKGVKAVGKGTWGLAKRVTGSTGPATTVGGALMNKVKPVAALGIAGGSAVGGAKHLGTEMAQNVNNLNKLPTF